MIGWIFITLTMIGYAILAVSYKLSDFGKCSKNQVNFFLFLFGSSLALILALATKQIAFPRTLVAISIGHGIITFFNVAAFRLAVSRGRISTSWTILSMTLVVPVLASILIWHQIPKLHHYVGFTLILLSILFLGIDVGKAKE